MTDNSSKSKNTAVIFLCVGLCLCLIFSIIGCLTILQAKKTDSTNAARLTTEIATLEAELQPLKQQQATLFEQSGFSSEYNSICEDIAFKQALKEQKQLELTKAENGKTLEEKTLIITILFIASLSFLFFSIVFFILLKKGLVSDSKRDLGT